MLKNRKLSRARSSVSWITFITKLDYKIAENQGCIVKIDRFYPSSKTCSNCGNVKKELKLSERTYHCTECGFTIDRDLNASINILKAGLNMIEATVATTGTSLKNQSLRSSKKALENLEKNCETRKTIKKRKESL